MKSSPNQQLFHVTLFVAADSNNIMSRYFQATGLSAVKYSRNPRIPFGAIAATVSDNTCGEKKLFSGHVEGYVVD